MSGLSFRPLIKPRSLGASGFDQIVRSGVEAINIITAYTHRIGSIDIKGATPLRSGLVGGIGIINLYELKTKNLGSLSDLSLNGLDRFRRVKLDGKKVQTLRQFMGDISSENLYLMEYPGGFVLSLGDELLAFSL